MKTLYSLILFLMLSLASFAQPNVDDNTLTIPKASITMETIKKTLLLNSYQFEDVTNDYIVTKYKPCEGSVYANGFTVSIFMMISDDKIVAYSNYKFNSMGTDYSGRGTYAKRTNIGKRMAFDEVDKVVRQLSNNVTYSAIK